MDVGACLVGEGVRGRAHVMSIIRLLSLLQKGMHFNVKSAYDYKSYFISEAEEFQRRKVRQRLTHLEVRRQWSLHFKSTAPYISPSVV